MHLAVTGLEMVEAQFFARKVYTNCLFSLLYTPCSLYYCLHTSILRNNVRIPYCGYGQVADGIGVSNDVERPGKKRKKTELDMQGNASGSKR